MPARSLTSRTPPRDLAPPFRTLWTETIKVLEDQGTWADHDVPRLERYIRALARAHEIRESLEQPDTKKVERLAQSLEYLARAAGQMGDAELDAELRGAISDLAEPLMNLAAPKYTTRGSQGQIVQHPNVKTLREAERDADDYAEKLLLTPTARVQHQEYIKSPKGGAGAGKFGGILS